MSGIENTQVRRIRLKCRFEGDIRIVTIAPDTQYNDLKRRLCNDYGFEISLKYEDRDGDFVLLSSQNDLDDLFLFCNLETVNATVSEAVSLPNLQRKNTIKNSSSLFNANPVNSSSRDWARSNAQSSNLAVQSPSVSSRPTPTARLERFPSISENSGNNLVYQNGSRSDNHNTIRWKRGEVLGQGAFGIVHLGLNIDTGELMAVKQMASEDVSRRELSSLENEISLLRSLRHPNIVRYIGTEVSATALSIFLEYVPGGSLRALIDKFGALEEPVARLYTRQLLLGLEYLHRNGFAHRDIKGANCLVGNDGVVKLADFGNSKHWRANNSSVGSVGNPPQQPSGDIKGTPAWMAPEVVRDQGGVISWKKADLWSLACTTLEMTTGKPPWSQFNNPVTILYHIACQDTLPEYPNPASIELVTFLNTCLQRDPSARPDITSLLLHPFVANVGSNSVMNQYGTNSHGTNNNHNLQIRPSTVSSLIISEWDNNSQQNRQFQFQPQSAFYSQQQSIAYSPQQLSGYDQRHDVGNRINSAHRDRTLNNHADSTIDLNHQTYRGLQFNGDGSNINQFQTIENNPQQSNMTELSTPRLNHSNSARSRNRIPLFNSVNNNEGINEAVPASARSFTSQISSATSLSDVYHAQEKVLPSSMSVSSLTVDQFDNLISARKMNSGYPIDRHASSSDQQLRPRSSSNSIALPPNYQVRASYEQINNSREEMRPGSLNRQSDQNQLDHIMSRNRFESDSFDLQSYAELRPTSDSQSELIQLQSEAKGSIHSSHSTMEREYYYQSDVNSRNFINISVDNGNQLIRADSLASEYEIKNGSEYVKEFNDNSNAYFSSHPQYRDRQSEIGIRSGDSVGSLDSVDYPPPTMDFTLDSPGAHLHENIEISAVSKIPDASSFITNHSRPLVSAKPRMPPILQKQSQKKSPGPMLERDRSAKASKSTQSRRKKRSQNSGPSNSLLAVSVGLATYNANEYPLGTSYAASDSEVSAITLQSGIAPSSAASSPYGAGGTISTFGQSSYLQNSPKKKHFPSSSSSGLGQSNMQTIESNIFVDNQNLNESLSVSMLDISPVKMSARSTNKPMPLEGMITNSQQPLPLLNSNKKVNDNIIENKSIVGYDESDADSQSCINPWNSATEGELDSVSRLDDAEDDDEMSFRHDKFRYDAIDERDKVSVTLQNSNERSKSVEHLLTTKKIAIGSIERNKPLTVLSNQATNKAGLPRSMTRQTTHGKKRRPSLTDGVASMQLNVQKYDESSSDDELIDDVPTIQSRSFICKEKQTYKKKNNNGILDEDDAISDAAPIIEDDDEEMSETNSTIAGGQFKNNFSTSRHSLTQTETVFDEVDIVGSNASFRMLQGGLNSPGIQMTSGPGNSFRWGEISAVGNHPLTSHGPTGNSGSSSSIPRSLTARGRARGSTHSINSSAEIEDDTAVSKWIDCSSNESISVDIQNPIESEGLQISKLQDADLSEPLTITNALIKNPAHINLDTMSKMANLSAKKSVLMSGPASTRSSGSRNSLSHRTLSRVNSSKKIQNNASSVGAFSPPKCIPSSNNMAQFDQNIEINNAISDQREETPNADLAQNQSSVSTPTPLNKQKPSRSLRQSNYSVLNTSIDQQSEGPQDKHLSTSNSNLFLNLYDRSPTPQSLPYDAALGRDILCDSLDQLQITGISAKYNQKDNINPLRNINTASGSSSSSLEYLNKMPGSASSSVISSNQLLKKPSAFDVKRSSKNENIVDQSSTGKDTSQGYDFREVDDEDDDYIVDDVDANRALHQTIPILLDQHNSAVTRLRTPGNSNLLLSASTDGTIRLWGPDGQCRSVLDISTVLGNNGISSQVDSLSNFPTVFHEQRPERKISLGTKNSNTSNNSLVILGNINQPPVYPQNAGSLDWNDNDSIAGVGVTGNRGTSARSTTKVLNMWCDENCETIWGSYSDGGLRVWGGVDGKNCKLLKGHEEPVTALEGMNGAGGSIGSGYCLMATGSQDRTVRIWDARSKKPQVFLFRGHGDTVLALRWADGGRSVISSGKDKTIRIWDTRAGRLRVTMEKHFGAVNSLRMLSENWNRAGTAGPSQNLVATTLPGTNSSSRDGAILVSAGRDSMINLWTANGDCVGTQAAHRGAVNFISDINYKASFKLPNTGPSALMVSLGLDNVMKVWDLKRLKTVSELPMNVTANGVTTKAIWCGQSIVTSSSTGSIKLYDCTTSNNNNGGAANDSSSIAEGTANRDVKNVMEWSCTDLASHTASCTELIGTDSFIACASKSGQILRWNL